MLDQLEDVATANVALPQALEADGRDLAHDRFGGARVIPSSAWSRFASSSSGRCSALTSSRAPQQVRMARCARRRRRPCGRSPRCRRGRAACARCSRSRTSATPSRRGPGILLVRNDVHPHEIALAIDADDHDGLDRPHSRLCARRARATGAGSGKRLSSGAHPSPRDSAACARRGPTRARTHSRSTSSGRR